MFQREHYPTWTANEVELFVYPIEDAKLLGLRRLESEALGRALLAQGSEEAACWVATALAMRRERFGGLPDGAVAYERGTELVEGLAQYAEWQAMRETKHFNLPPHTFAADDVWRRGYASGQALALLLDRFDPGWKERLRARAFGSLDALLAATPAGTGAEPAGFSPREREEARARAAADVEDLQMQRTALRDRFLAQSGWKLVVIAGGAAPLWPQGFDPINVRRLGAGEVLHTRWLKLGNALGTLEALGQQSLTEAAGEHPLFHGVRRLTLAGIRSEPIVRESDGTTMLSATGLRGEFRDARTEHAGQTWLVTLGKT